MGDTSPEVMGDTSEYLACSINVRRRKDKSRIIYVSFGDVFFEMEFIEAWLSKLVISLSKVDILRIKVEDMQKNEDDMANLLVIILCVHKVIQFLR